MPQDARRDADCTGERGFALVIVIWGLGLLMIIVAAFTVTMQTHTKSVSNRLANAQAEAYADAGANLAIAKLVRLVAGRDTAAFDALVHAGDVVCRFGDAAELTVRVEDAGGKVDLNAASPELLAALFAGLGATSDDARALADAVVDFRDGDDSARPLGAERQAYLDGGRLAGPKNDRFHVVEELEQVLGVGHELFRAATPHLTVDSGRSGIDPETASARLQAAIVRGQSLTGGAEPAGAVALDRRFVTPSARTALSVHVTARAGDRAVFARQADVLIEGNQRHRYRITAWKQARGGDEMPSTTPSSGADGQHMAASLPCESL